MDADDLAIDADADAHVEQYFSTLERLRLAHGADPNIASDCAVRISKDLARPNLTRRNSSYFRDPRVRRFRKPQSPTFDQFSRADAEWFHKLPDKVQRKQFTREEQRILAVRRESVILDAADEVLYKLGRYTNRSVPTLRPSSPSSETSYASSIESFSAGSDGDMDEAMLKTFHWLDDDEELDLTLDDYHTHCLRSAEPKKRIISKRPTFRKAISLAPAPLSPFNKYVETASPPGSSQSSNVITAPRHTISPSPLAQPSSPTTTSPDTAATHYQDPSARLKLRVYLASPQKFDEAIEFGFPSLDETKDSSSLSRPSLSQKRCNTAPTPTTFFNDDSLSVFDTHDEGEDPESDEDNHEASETETVPPTQFLPENSLYAQSPAGNREMTLRMTLTRPVARDGVVYPSRVSEARDPLALEDLPPATNGRDIWDDLPKEKRMRKLWRKVSGK